MTYLMNVSMRRKYPHSNGALAMKSMDPELQSEGSRALRVRRAGKAAAQWSSIMN